MGIPIPDRSRACLRTILFNCRPVVPIFFQKSVSPDIVFHRNLKYIINDQIPGQEYQKDHRPHCGKRKAVFPEKPVIGRRNVHPGGSIRHMIKRLDLFLILVQLKDIVKPQAEIIVPLKISHCNRLLCGGFHIGQTVISGNPYHLALGRGSPSQKPLSRKSSVICFPEAL